MTTIDRQAAIHEPNGADLSGAPVINRTLRRPDLPAHTVRLPLVPEQIVGRNTAIGTSSPINVALKDTGGLPIHESDLRVREAGRRFDFASSEYRS